MLLEGRKGLIVGVANKRSIAWGIAEALDREGARLAFNYQGERLEGNVRKLTEPLAGSLLFPCDVTRPEEIDALFGKVGEEFGSLDFLVHCVAFAPREDLEGAFLDTSPQGFRTALEVSAYSLTALARRAAPLMKGGGSVLALSYLGAERVVPGYNVMGVAKAALEASVRYLAHDLGKEVAVAAQHRAGGGGGFGALPMLRPVTGHHRRGALRRLRLSHHGDVSGERPRNPIRS
jgi:enoyl-[acyl-carrier protein] reductase I